MRKHWIALGFLAFAAGAIGESVYSAVSPDPRLPAMIAAAQRGPAPSDPHDPAPWSCSPTDKVHPCHCDRMDDDAMCEGTIHEDSHCARFCVPDKCHCPVHCKVS